MNQLHKLLPALLVLPLLGAGARAQGPATAGGFQVLGKPPGKVHTQDMGAFPGGKWQDNDQLWWTGAEPGDKLRLLVPIKQEGTYHVRVLLTKAVDYGIVQLSLAGKKAAGRLHPCNLGLTL